MGEGVDTDHGKGAGTTDSAPVGPTGDAGPIKPGGTKVYPPSTLLSCLGQGADLVVSTTRSSAVGIMLTPPKLERVPTWGSA
jgi:hypothetical protein